MLDRIIADIVREERGVEAGAVEELRQKQNGKPLSALVVQKGWMTEEELLSALGARLGIPYWGDLESHGLDPSLVSRVPIPSPRSIRSFPSKWKGAPDRGGG